MALAYAASTFRLHFGICVAQPYLILTPITKHSCDTCLIVSNAASQFDFQNFLGGLVQSHPRHCYDYIRIKIP